MNLTNEALTLKNILEVALRDILNERKLVIKDWFSLKEAAEYIGVSINTLAKYREMGLVVSEIEGVKRVSRKELDRFLETHSN